MKITSTNNASNKKNSNNWFSIKGKVSEIPAIKNLIKKLSESYEVENDFADTYKGEYETDICVIDSNMTKAKMLKEIRSIK